MHIVIDILDRINLNRMSSLDFCGFRPLSWDSFIESASTHKPAHYRHPEPYNARLCDFASGLIHVDTPTNAIVCCIAWALGLQ